MMMVMKMMMCSTQKGGLVVLVKGITWVQEAKSERSSASSEAGDVRESRSGFGCQPVFSAIISSASRHKCPRRPRSVSLTWPLPHLLPQKQQYQQKQQQQNTTRVLSFLMRRECLTATHKGRNKCRRGIVLSWPRSEPGRKGRREKGGRL